MAYGLKACSCHPLIDWSAYINNILDNILDSESGPRGGVPECQYPPCVCVGGVTSVNHVDPLKKQLLDR